jgi:hypothetical protein
MLQSTSLDLEHIGVFLNQRKETYHMKFAVLISQLCLIKTLFASEHFIPSIYTFKNNVELKNMLFAVAVLSAGI